MSQTSEITVINSEKKYQRHRRVELVQKRSSASQRYGWKGAGKRPERTADGSRMRSENQETKVKSQRAQDGCLGTESRRKT